MILVAAVSIANASANVCLIISCGYVNADDVVATCTFATNDAVLTADDSISKCSEVATAATATSGRVGISSRTHFN